MNTIQRTTLIKAIAFVLISAAMLLGASVQAAVITWDGGHASVDFWFAPVNWAPGDPVPADNDDLVFSGTTRLTHNSWADLGSPSDNDFDINSITFDGAAGAFVINNGGGPGGSIITLQGDITNDSTNLQTMNFPFQLNAGNRTVHTNTDDITIGGIISEDGSARALIKDGSNTLTLTAANTYTGGTNIQEGTVVFTNNDAFGTGQITLGIESNVDQTMEFGANGLDLSEATFIQNSIGKKTIRLDLAGTNTGTLSGNMFVREDNADPEGLDFDVGTADTLTVSGNITADATAGNAEVTKTGAGTLVLSGANTYKGNTTVDAGTLLVNGSHLPTLGSGAYTVDSTGTLGGTGTIGGNITGITINSGGFLSPGDGGVGTLTLDTPLDISGISISSLLFDLGAVPTSDLLLMSSDTLTIGTGLLDLDDFLFTDLGASVGTYTLFESGGISGSLGPNTMDTILGGTFKATLFQDGNDIKLQLIIPEPSTFALMLIGLVGLCLSGRRRKR